MKLATRLFFLFMVLFIVSCSFPSEEKIETKPQETVLPSSEIAESIAESNASETTEIPLQETLPEQQLDPEIEELIAKGRNAANYNYFFSSLVRDNYGIYTETSYTVFVKEEKTKKVYLNPKKLRGDIFYNEIYLDNTKKTAIGICTKIGILCEKILDKAYAVDYLSEKIDVTPAELLKGVGLNAAKVGEEVIDNRKTTIIEYTNAKGQKERLSLDNHFGLPLKQIIYETSDDQEIILETNRFSKFSVGNVLTKEVTLPEKYQIVE